MLGIAVIVSYFSRKKKTILSLMLAVNLLYSYDVSFCPTSG